MYIHFFGFVADLLSAEASDHFSQLRNLVEKLHTELNVQQYQVNWKYGLAITMMRKKSCSLKEFCL